MRPSNLLVNPNLTNPNFKIITSGAVLFYDPKLGSWRVEGRMRLQNLKTVFVSLSELSIDAS